MRYRLMLCLLCACSWGRARAPSAPSKGVPEDEELSQTVHALMSEHHRLGVAAAVTENGRVVWHGHYGVADQETEEPVTETTIFPVCSLSKPVLLSAVLKTVDAMALGGHGTPAQILDTDIQALLRPIGEFLIRNPRFPDVPITLRMLLSHVSSIRDDYDDVPHHTAAEPPHFEYTGLQLEDALRRYLSPLPILEQHFSTSAPGEQDDYSGIGVSLAALFVSAQNGVPYEEYVQTKVFDELGMRHSAFRMAPLVARYPDLRQYAAPYHFDAKTGANLLVAPRYTEHTYFPAASLRSTALDYAAFIAALAGTPQGSGLLSPALLAEIKRVQYPTANGEKRGLVLVHAERAGMKILGHLGRNPGLTSSMMFTTSAPEGGVYGVVVLTNGDADVNGATFEARLGEELLRRALRGTLRQANVVFNQVGFVADSRPEFTVLSSRPLSANDIELRDARGPLTVELGTPRFDEATKSWVQRVKSAKAISTSLEIQIRHGEVHHAEVLADPYRGVRRSLLRSYYLQRCGRDIVDPVSHADRPACHLADGVRARSDVDGYQGSKVSAIGGWHDAGDYGKYVPTTATVLIELLARYERYPELLRDDDLGIPESGNGVPDLLDEMRVGLDWMLTMQRSDGAVYRKLSGASWPLRVAPDLDTQVRYAYGVSSADTAKAAAAWALAARVYRPIDPGAAHGFLQAAQAAWSYASGLRAHFSDVLPEDNSGSGPYMLGELDDEPSLRTDADDLLAAAIELYLTTRDADLARQIDARLPSYQLTVFEWKDVASVPVATLLWHTASRPGWQKLARAKIEHRAAQALERARANPFGVANEHFVWGSNKLVAEEGIVLLAAARVAGSSELQDAAWAQLHYLLGANPLDKCFVTGFGHNPVRRVSHLFVRATGKLFPGLFVGGPNDQPRTEFVPPKRGMLSYVDDDRSYDTNEYAIDYDSALLALLIDLQARDRVRSARRGTHAKPAVH